MELKDVKELLAAFDASGATKMRWREGDSEVMFSSARPDPIILGGALGPTDAGFVAEVPATAGAGSTPNVAGAPTAAAPAAGSTGTDVPSPIIGLFYRAPSPTEPPFVQVGDHVEVGQVLCIIEAMKVMNEVHSPVAGEITAIHAANAERVQYGQSLFTIKES